MGPTISDQCQAKRALGAFQFFEEELDKHSFPHLETLRQAQTCLDVEALRCRSYASAHPFLTERFRTLLQTTRSWRDLQPFFCKRFPPESQALAICRLRELLNSMREWSEIARFHSRLPTDLKTYARNRFHLILQKVASWNVLLLIWDGVKESLRDLVEERMQEFLAVCENYQALSLWHGFTNRCPARWFVEDRMCAVIRAASFTQTPPWLLSLLAAPQSRPPAIWGALADKADEISQQLYK